jgi:hypothetical protein
MTSAALRKALYRRQAILKIKATHKVFIATVQDGATFGDAEGEDLDETIEGAFEEFDRKQNNFK